MRKVWNGAAISVQTTIRSSRRLERPVRGGSSPTRVQSTQTSCPDTVQDDGFRRFSRRAWARLIRKVYLINPLTCPKCGGRLRIPSFIDNPSVIEKILRHLKLWDPPERPPPPRRSTTLEPDADFLDWAATTRQSDGID